MNGLFLLVTILFATKHCKAADDTCLKTQWRIEEQFMLNRTTCETTWNEVSLDGLAPLNRDSITNGSLGPFSIDESNRIYLYFAQDYSSDGISSYRQLLDSSISEFRLFKYQQPGKYNAHEKYGTCENTFFTGIKESQRNDVITNSEDLDDKFVVAIGKTNFWREGVSFAAKVSVNKNSISMSKLKASVQIHDMDATWITSELVWNTSENVSYKCEFFLELIIRNQLKIYKSYIKNKESNISQKLNYVIFENDMVYNLYVYLSFFCWICIIIIQLTQIEKSIEANEVRLSNIGNFLTQVSHILLITIPVIWSVFSFSINKNFKATVPKWNTDTIGKIYPCLVIYIFVSIIFLICERFMIFKLKEFFIWMESIPLFLSIITLCWLFNIYDFSMIPNEIVLSAGWVTNIICNIISRRAVSDCKFLLYLKIFLLSCTPYSYYHFTSPEDSFITRLVTNKLTLTDVSADLRLFECFVLHMAVQFVLARILLKQSKCGSRFFLPDKFRTKIYDNYTRDFTAEVRACKVHDECSCQPKDPNYVTYGSGSEYLWNVCWNQLCQPEFEFSDERDESPKREFGVYYQLPCNHTFHVNCLLRMLEQELVCPKCGVTVPKNNWDD